MIVSVEGKGLECQQNPYKVTVLCGGGLMDDMTCFV